MMLTFIVLVQHLLIPAVFLFWLWRDPYPSRARWCATLALAGGYIGFISLIGAWGWVGYPLRVLFPVLLVVAVFVSWRRVRDLPWRAPRAWTATLDTGFRGALGAVFIAGFVHGLAGYVHPDDAVELDFPLNEGVYLIGQGGATTIINYHNAYPPQRYALDILKLNSVGLRARGLYPRDLDAYAIFGDTVHSPCDGTVVWVVDGLPDHVPPDSDPENPAGNVVAIECHDVVVYLAHLMEGSVVVTEAEQVASGQPLGRVGNSGNTSEPHLHIHAEPLPFTGGLGEEPGIPIHFSGRFLVRNSLVY